MKTLLRLPNWLGDFVMSLPIIRALEKKNPDLVCFALRHFSALYPLFGFSAEFSALPPKNKKLQYFRHFWSMRGEFERAILLANSERADFECFLSGAKNRYGVAWAERRRFLVNQRYFLPQDFSTDARHQVAIWQDFLRYFDLAAELDFSPFSINSQKTERSTKTISFICGSENSPEKRWSPEKYANLIREIKNNFSDTEIFLLGTEKDFAICEQISSCNKEVQNLAGTTDLREFAQKLAASSLVVGNDTGGIHLANAFGIPTIALFGPTNPRKTAPIFSAPLAIIQPENCPETGGADIDEITVEKVLLQVEKML
ncbi:MAG: glycosyltransferase family 9 protein [Cardiobacteriaceae bacterium]|nr:glycosyltransferase family 9 protein [Cardiobacteriaceae bacterium]